MNDKEKNRARFPVATKVIDEFRRAFGDSCKVLYAREGALKMGTKAKEVCRSEET